MSIRINGVNKDTVRDYEKTFVGADSSSQEANFSSQTAHGTYHMADNANLYEIQRSNNFEFIVYFGEDLIKAGLTLDGGSTDTIDADVAQEVLRMSVSEASIPHFSQNPIAIKRGNSTIKYAGTPEFADGTLTLNDYIGADTKSILMSWQNLSYNVSTEKVGLASDYKKEAHLIEYTPDLQQVRSWTLKGCWITNITEPNYSSEDNGKHTISVTIAYDKAILDSNL